MAILEDIKKGNLPERMSRQLGWRFSLDQGTLERLRYASKPGRLGLLKTTFVRVFDPALLQDEAPAVRRYGDLDAHQAAIQFEGRFHRERFDDLVDLRTAAT